jgi:signal transduction histidine kinase
VAFDIAGDGKPPRRRSWTEIITHRRGRLAPTDRGRSFLERAIGRYGLAVVAIAAATSATYTVGALAEKPWAFPFYAAIVASAWFGIGPGCVAVILASASVEYLYASPPLSLHVGPADLPWFASFVLCAFVSLTWSTQRRLAQRGLEETVQRRTADLRQSNAALQVEIVERQAAEEELRRSETLLAQGQQLSRTASWTLHWPAGDMRWSAQLYDILGLAPAAAAPSYGVLIERIHPGDRDRFVEALAQAIEKGGEFSCEARIAGESAKHVQALGEVKRGADDSIELIGTIADVTERKETEQALRDAEAELARTLRLATLAELAAAIAHEINQPLAAITANGSACVRSLAHQPPMLDNAREAASCIVADGHRAAAVIARIRALFNKEEPDQELLDVNTVIDHVLDLSRGAIARQQIAVRTEFATPRGMVIGDRVQLQQVLVNLVTNALEAIAEVDDRLHVLTIRSEAETDELIRVTVEDTGCGLEPGQLAGIFDSFYTTKPDGIGVGLAISRSIIEAHGGTLWAAAAIPHGARIGFTLPAAAPRTDDPVAEEREFR